MGRVLCPLNLWLKMVRRKLIQKQALRSSKNHLILISRKIESSKLHFVALICSYDFKNGNWYFLSLRKRTEDFKDFVFSKSEDNCQQCLTWTGRKKLTKKKDESEQNWWKLFWNKKLLPKGGTSWSPLLRNDSTHSCWVQGKVEIPLTRKVSSVQSNGAGEPSNSPAMWGSFRGRYESLTFRGEDTHKISPACTVICSIHIACVPSLMNKGERTDELSRP